MWILELIAHLTAATGLSTANATIVVAAINAGWMLMSILTMFSGLGLTLMVLKQAAKQKTTGAMVAW